MFHKRMKLLHRAFNHKVNEVRCKMDEVRPGQPYDQNTMRLEVCDVCRIEFMTNSQQPYCPRHAELYLEKEFDKAQAYSKNRVTMWFNKFRRWQVQLNLTGDKMEWIAKWMNIFGDRLKEVSRNGEARQGFPATWGVEGSTEENGGGYSGCTEQ